MAIGITVCISPNGRIHEHFYLITKEKHMTNEINKQGEEVVDMDELSKQESEAPALISDPEPETTTGSDESEDVVEDVDEDDDDDDVDDDDDEDEDDDSTTATE